MKKKRIKEIILLAFFVIAVAGNLYAQNMGDLVLNLEPQIGLNVLPYEQWSNKYMNGMVLGFDYAINANVSYYFVSFFSVNAGAGIEGTYNAFHANGSSSYSSPRYGLGDFVTDLGKYNNTNKSSGGIRIGPKVGELSTLYLSIPFGVRLTLGSFSIGGGLKGNILLSSSGYYYYDDLKFDVSSYLGWYADMSFSSNKLTSWGIQVSDSLTRNIKIDNQPVFEPFSLFTVSFLLRFKIPLAKIPIGGN